MINAGTENSGTENADVKITRCPWCLRNPIYMAYHDEEWGNPEKDSQKLFEGLVLDSMQAGLSWITILKRRDDYRAAFDGFNAQKIARYRDADITRLMGRHHHQEQAEDRLRYSERPSLPRHDGGRPGEFFGLSMGLCQ